MQKKVKKMCRIVNIGLVLMILSLFTFDDLFFKIESKKEYGVCHYISENLRDIEDSYKVNGSVPYEKYDECISKMYMVTTTYLKAQGVTAPVYRENDGIEIGFFHYMHFDYMIDDPLID